MNVNFDTILTVGDGGGGCLLTSGVGYFQME